MTVQCCVHLNLLRIIAEGLSVTQPKSGSDIGTNLTLLRVIIISLLQGVSELFPVSSLGHAVILPAILHWNINETKPAWLAFLVALHIGTAAALLIYFWGEWKTLALAFIQTLQQRKIGTDSDQRLAWMVIAGTIPAGVIGLVLEKRLRSLFADPKLAACFLIVNGLIMFGGERLIRRQKAMQRGSVGTGGAAQLAIVGEGRYRDISQLSLRDAAIVGFAQIGALIPGISRSGVTMVAGLAAGLTHEASAKYAFLLATPIIGAAGILELPKLFAEHGNHFLLYSVIGAMCAGVGAYLSVRFLMKYFETGRLDPFAYYCVAAGALSLILLTAGM